MSPEMKRAPTLAGVELSGVQTGGRILGGQRVGRKKLPPYAKALAAARARGMAPRFRGFGHVAVVLDWRERRTGGLHRVVIPPDAELEDLDLTCFSGLHILLSHGDSEGSRAAVVVDALLVAGAYRVDAANVDAVLRGEPWDKSWPVFMGVSHGA